MKVVILASKLALQVVLEQLANVADMKIAWLRLFLHVEDVAEAIWTVARSDLSGPVNIGSGKSVSMYDIVTKIEAILNRSELIAIGVLPYRGSDPMFICAINLRLIENTNWAPRLGLEDGLRHTIEWWQGRVELD